MKLPKVPLCTKISPFYRSPVSVCVQAPGWDNREQTLMAEQDRESMQRSLPFGEVLAKELVDRREEARHRIQVLRSIQDYMAKKNRTRKGQAYGN